jgi:DNA polymerase-3 subunit beta
MTTAHTTATTVAPKQRRTKRSAATLTPAADAAPVTTLTLSIAQKALQWGLEQTNHAVASKSTLPVLGNVLLTAERSQLKLAATNLEIAIIVRLDATVTQEGALTVPAKLLADVVSHLPSEAIDLTLDGRTQTLGVRCERAQTNIKGIAAEEFPPLPTLASSRPIAALPALQLRQAIDQVAHAAASDDTRPVLAGVLIRLAHAQATFAAADGFRLAVRRVDLDAPIAAPTEVIVPARALIELARVLRELGPDDEVELFVAPAANHILFHTERVDIIIRTIEGAYPDVERIIPTSYTTRAVMAGTELAAAVRLASYFAAASANIVRLTFEPGGGDNGTLTISANAAEVGDNQSSQAATLEGPGGQVALNVRFLAESIAAMRTPTIALHINTAQQPVVLTGVGDAQYIYVIMPMTVHA